MTWEPGVKKRQENCIICSHIYINPIGSCCPQGISDEIGFYALQNFVQGNVIPLTFNFADNSLFLRKVRGSSRTLMFLQNKCVRFNKGSQKGDGKFFLMTFLLQVEVKVSLGTNHNFGDFPYSLPPKMWTRTRPVADRPGAIRNIEIWNEHTQYLWSTEIQSSTICSYWIWWNNRATLWLYDKSKHQNTLNGTWKFLVDELLWR